MHLGIVGSPAAMSTEMTGSITLTAASEATTSTMTVTAVTTEATETALTDEFFVRSRRRPSHVVLSSEEVGRRRSTTTVSMSMTVGATAETKVLR